MRVDSNNGNAGETSTTRVFQPLSPPRTRATMRARKRGLAIAFVLSFLASISTAVVLPRDFDALGRVYSLVNGDLVHCPRLVSHKRNGLYPIVDGKLCVGDMLMHTDAEAVAQFKRIVNDNDLVQLGLPRFEQADSYIAVYHHHARVCGAYKFDPNTVHLFSRFGDTRTLAIASKSQICAYTERDNAEQHDPHLVRRGMKWFLNKFSRQQASQSPFPSKTPLPVIEMSAIPIPSSQVNVSAIPTLVPLVVPFIVSSTPSTSIVLVGSSTATPSANVGSGTSSAGTGTASSVSISQTVAPSTSSSATTATNPATTSISSSVSASSTAIPVVIDISTVQQNLQNVILTPIPGMTNFPILSISIASNRATLIPTPSLTPSPSKSSSGIAVQNAGPTPVATLTHTPRPTTISSVGMTASGSAAPSGMPPTPAGISNAVSPSISESLTPAGQATGLLMPSLGPSISVVFLPPGASVGLPAPTESATPPSPSASAGTSIGISSISESPTPPSRATGLLPPSSLPSLSPFLSNAVPSETPRLFQSPITVSPLLTATSSKSSVAVEASTVPTPLSSSGLPNFPQFTTFPAISINVAPQATLTVVDPSTIIQAGLLTSQSASPSIAPTQTHTPRPSPRPSASQSAMFVPLIFSTIPLAIGPSAPASPSSSKANALPAATHTARPVIATVSPSSQAQGSLSQQPQASSLPSIVPSSSSTAAGVASTTPKASTSRTPRPSSVASLSSSANVTPSPTTTHTARPAAAASPSSSGIAAARTVSTVPGPTSSPTAGSTPVTNPVTPTPTRTRAPAPTKSANSTPSNMPVVNIAEVIPSSTGTHTPRPSPIYRAPTTNQATSPVASSQAPKVSASSTPTRSLVVAIPVTSQSPRPIAIPQSSNSPRSQSTGPSSTASHTPLNIHNPNLGPTLTHTPKPTVLPVEMSKSPDPTAAIPTRTHTPPPTVLSGVFIASARPTQTYTPAPSIRPPIVPPPRDLTNGSPVPTLTHTPAPSKFTDGTRASASPVVAIPQSSTSPSSTDGLGIAQVATASPSASVSVSMSVSVSPTASASKTASIGGGGGTPASTSPSISPSVSANASTTPTPGGGSVCFPGSARATLEDGQPIRFDELSIGARVLTANGQYSEVYGFSHATDELYRFVTLHTASGTLTLTAGHHVYTDRGVFAARDVQPGDKLVLGQGGLARVERVGSAVQRGLYNPHTVLGTIVVEGFVTSTYTEHVDYRMAQAALAPFRALFACGARFDALTSVLEKGLYDAAQTWVV